MQNLQTTMACENVRLEDYTVRMAGEIVRAKQLMTLTKMGQIVPDFDIRGRLYDLALQIAPHARDEEFIRFQKAFIRPIQGMVCIDIAAGSGFHTLPLAKSVQTRVMAVDVSSGHLALLANNATAQGIDIQTVVCAPDDERILKQVPAQVDLVTSFGGLHHVNDQAKMFQLAARLLKPGGRFVAGDVGAGTTLARHFDEFVTAHCLTSHSAQWLDEVRITTMAATAGLTVTQMERVPLQWHFTSDQEMALFFQGLHAYDLPQEQIVQDLETALGVERQPGKVSLNWPMFFFELTKPM